MAPDWGVARSSDLFDSPRYEQHKHIGGEPPRE